MARQAKKLVTLPDAIMDEVLAKLMLFLIFEENLKWQQF
jgi:hypothetical protein